MDLVRRCISTFGKAFNDNRIIAIVWIVLPVIGLLERYGLQQRAAALIREHARRDDRAAADPLSALPPDHRRDRPALDRRPPADGAAAGRADGAGRGREAAWRARRGRRRRRSRPMSAATDNVGLFFGEDIFFAIGSIVLIQQIAGDLRLQPRAARAGGVGDPERDLRLPDPRRAAAAARPQAGEARPMITLHWLYALAGAMFAAFALLSARSTAPTRKRFGNAAFWGLMALSLLGRRLHRRLRQRPAGARPRRPRRLRLHRPQPSADDQRRGARSLVRAARQQAVPAGADHPGRPR